MKRQVFTLSLLGLAMFANAQKTMRELIRGDKGITKHDVRLPENLQAGFTPSAAKTFFGLDALSNLVVKKQEADKLGFLHYRFTQTYKGFPIENAMYVVHTKGGKITGASGSIVIDWDNEGAHPDKASITAQKAISLAMKQVNAQEYAWQNPRFEAAYKAQKDAAATYAPKPELAWFSDDDDVNPRALRLAYKVDIYALNPLSRAYYFIDAATGEYLGKKDIINQTDATGTAATAYSGTQTIHSDYTGSSYRLRDLTKGNGIITLHGETASKGTDYTSSSANWSYSSSKNQAALDAHYGVSQTYAYYYSTFGRNSYDNAGTALTSYVNLSGTSDNAYWDGSAMNFGTRSTGAYGGVTGIDVTGHELTHGVTQEESGLNYSKEPGAMNESMSDIFGKTVQFWSKPSDVNWKLSNDMAWYIRDMSNPNAYSQPDTYKGTKWTTSSSDNYGVHTNSGVGNFMYYLLVTGGSGTNDNGNSYSVTGIGLTEAAAILYRTNTVYLTATSQYADWRTACINAATDLYGASSNEVTQVQNAWYAVGVGTAGGGGSTCTAPTGLAAGSITNTSATLSWAAVTGATSYTLQYKLASASTWTTITGITSASYSLTGLTAGASYNAQVATVCSGGTSAYSTAITFSTTSGTVTYCTSSGGSSDEYINKVVLGSISNTSGNNGGYGNFTSLSTTLAAGSSYTATLTPGFTSTQYNEAWTMWIDYNGDGDFTDSGEKVGTATAAKTAKTITFSVPATAKNGSTRIRIQMKYSSASTASCGTYSYGEVEDYTANITGGSGLMPTSFVANSINGVNVSSNALSVYPNPVAHGNATVSYTLAKEGSTTLKVFDMAGRSAQTISFGKQASGAHTYSLSASGKLNNGNYMIVLEQDGQVISRTKLAVTE